MTWIELGDNKILLNLDNVKDIYFDYKKRIIVVDNRDRYLYSSPKKAMKKFKAIQKLVMRKNNIEKLKDQIDQLQEEFDHLPVYGRKYKKAIESRD